MVTTDISPIRSDETQYEVMLSGGESSNSAHVKAVAAVSGRNFLQAKELLEKQSGSLFSGQAVAVERARQVLLAAKVPHRIVPEFPYSA